ncbi:DUF1015 domain-containing protein [Nitrospira moscoviensis]|uniref:DUF1015 domain-containing protein n=1 Tax=Nitrospira moscoviensis TaxID=42253 RepID=A0A0K2GH05_NITMO|nr:DUF1015 domain-containing protein [Nitrospira moscoviensis]ALA60129.1 hypothetical protein NITMOv2_3738 [Nitrospira moscoviensis]
MSQIIPFRGTLYDPSVVGDIAQVAAPPYDIIDAAGQRALHDRHPQNIIRLELGLDQAGDSPAHNRYTRAAATLKDWLKTGALKRDAQPAVYYHTIEYRVPSSDPQAPRKVLRGFLATTKLESLDSGHIYPHENTRAAAKTDRLNLLQACKANFSPIWLLYSDPQNAVLSALETAVKGQPARIDFTDDSGCRQQLWTVSEPAVLKQVVEALQSKPLFIADGHHRYETALNYQRIRREQAGQPAGLHPYDAVLMMLAPLEDPGLTVLPTHRVITTALPPYAQVKTLLGETFDVQEFPFTAADRTAARTSFITALRTQGRTVPTFGLALAGADRYVTLALKPAYRPSAQASPRARLDVSLLQQLVVAKLCPTQEAQEAILYTKDDHEALDWAAQGKGTGALLLNATKVSEVQAVATAGERMPHKSTYFYPKPLTGLVINVMEE